MKMKRIMSSILLFFLLFFVSCTKGGDELVQENYQSMIDSTKNSLFPVVHFDDILNMEYHDASFREKESLDMKAKTFSLQGKSLKTPYSLLTKGTDLLIVDIEANEIVLANSQGKVLRVIGKTGNGEDAFLTPTAVAWSKDQYYVIDHGNRRVKVLDAQFRFLRSVQLPIFEDEGDKRFTSIAVDKKGTIYVTGKFIKNAGIYRAERSEDHFSKMVPYFVGALYSESGRVFAINYGNVYAAPENFEIGFGPYRNHLWEIVDQEMKEVMELPTKLQTESFAINQKIYVLSSNRQGLLVFDKQGYTYQEVLSLKNRDDFPNSIMLLKRDIYITDPQHHQILKVEGVE